MWNTVSVLMCYLTTLSLNCGVCRVVVIIECVWSGSGMIQKKAWQVFGE